MGQATFLRQAASKSFSTVEPRCFAAVSVAQHGQRYRRLADDESLLLIILDYMRRANFGFVRIIPTIAKSTSLTQEVPALIQFDLDLCEPLTVGFCVSSLLVQSVFFFDKALDMNQNRLILGLVFHESLLQRG